MGGIVSSVLALKHATKPNQNPQDDALSYKGKIGALKLLINSDSSKSALLKYLTVLNKDCILIWYMDLDEYKKTKNDNLLYKAIEIRNRYDPNFHIGSTSPAFADVWKSVDETLPKQKSQELVDGIPAAIDNTQISKNVKIAQDFIYSTLANELDGFMQSSHYREWESVYGKENESPDVKKHSLMTSDITLDNKIKEKYFNLLIIDDSPAHSKYVASIFESNGHRVRIANHGRVGVNIAISFSFAAIFVDMTIKTMDPVEIAKSIREWENEMSGVSGRNKVSNRNLLSINSKKIGPHSPSIKANKEASKRKLSNVPADVSSALASSLQPSVENGFTAVSMGAPPVPFITITPVKRPSKSAIMSPRASQPHPQPSVAHRLLIALVTNSDLIAESMSASTKELPNAEVLVYDECIMLSSSETTKLLEATPLLPPIQKFYEIIQKREESRDTKVEQKTIVTLSE